MFSAATIHFWAWAANNLAVTQDATGISAAWTVGQLTFTQRIELANAGASEHGMVYISYGLVNSGSSPVSVRARVLLDPPWVTRTMLFTRSSTRPTRTGASHRERSSAQPTTFRPTFLVTTT
jgi:hypothetical protein